MKKHGWPAILAGLILAAALLFAAQAEGELPEGIRETIGDLTVVKTAYWDDPGSTWFVLTRTPFGENMLLCFEREGGSWVRSFYTVAAVPQGDDAVEYLFITDKVVSFRDDRTLVIPGPVMAMIGTDGSRTSYRRDESGQWKLFDAFWQEEQVFVEFSDDSVVFRTPIDQDHEKTETVRGRLERDLRQVDFTRIPKSPRQAQEMIDAYRPEETQEP